MISWTMIAITAIKSSCGPRNLRAPTAAGTVQVMGLFADSAFSDALILQNAETANMDHR